MPDKYSRFAFIRFFLKPFPYFFFALRGLAGTMKSASVGMRTTSLLPELSYTRRGPKSAGLPSGYSCL